MVIHRTVWLLWMGLLGTTLTGYAQLLQRFEFAEPKMGTTFKLVFYAEHAQVAEEAAQVVFARIDELNLIFSDYREDSEVSQLAAWAGTAKKVVVSAELFEVLRFAKKLSRKSKGAFDVSIGPLSKLWRRAFRQQEFPDAKKLAAAKESVDYRQIKLYRCGRKVRLKKEHMRLDLGGIAKGYTVDAAYRVLYDYGISRALVDGGGDIYAGDPPPGKRFWEIAWSTGDDTEPQTIELANRAIASSGSAYKFLLWQGQKYAHIIDPRTGLGITETKTINVTAKNCMLADAFASTFSVVSPVERARLLAHYSDIQLLNESIRK